MEDLILAEPTLEVSQPTRTLKVLTPKLNLTQENKFYLSFREWICIETVWFEEIDGETYAFECWFMELFPIFCKNNRHQDWYNEWIDEVNRRPAFKASVTQVLGFFPDYF